MRRLILAVGLGLVLTVAGAAGPDDAATPEARAYFGFSFGGARVAPRDFHYGLRLDHDSRYVDGRVPALVQFDFTHAGFNAARINGLPVVRQEYRLRQDEQPAVEEVPAEGGAEGAEAVAEGGEAAAAGEPGLFSKIGSFFGGLFGGEDVEETTEGGEAATSEAAAGDGMFSSFTVVDWGLLAVGVVGLGAAAGEVSDGEESEDPPGGTDPTTDPTTDPGSDPGVLPAIIAGNQPRGAHDFLPAIENMSPEYQQWLDGGTGHMGDLGEHD